MIVIEYLQRSATDTGVEVQLHDINIIDVTSNSTSPEQDEGDGGLGAGAIAGIVVGVILAILVVIAVVFFLLKGKDKTSPDYV